MAKSESIKQALESIDSDFVRALAEPVRIELLRLLIVAGPSDVKTLAEQLPQDRSVISRHLATLLNAGILRSAKQGRHVVYRIDGDAAIDKAEKLHQAMRRCVQLGCC